MDDFRLLVLVAQWLGRKPRCAYSKKGLELGRGNYLGSLLLSNMGETLLCLQQLTTKRQCLAVFSLGRLPDTLCLATLLDGNLDLGFPFELRLDTLWIALRVNHLAIL